MSTYIKDRLLKEASEKIALFKESSATRAINNEVINDFLKEAESRVGKFKKASMQKEAMAQQQGVKDLRNSTANTKWFIPKPSARVQQIQNDIYAAFSPYFYGRGEHGKKTDINVGAYFPQDEALIPLPNEQKTYQGEPDATVRMEFRYRKEIIPVDKNFREDAVKAIDVLNKILPGYKEFIQDIDRMNIPLMPFFHQTIRSKEMGGGFTQSEIKNFIMQESEKYKRLPEGHPLRDNGAVKNFYKEHANRFASGENISITNSFGHERRYDRSYVFDISSQSVLIRAIAEKVQQGYWINSTSLYNDIKSQRDRMIQFHKYNPKTRKQQIRQKLNNYKKFFDDYYNQIANVFNDAINPIGPDDNALDFYSWGTNPDNKQPMRGLKIRNKKAKMTVHTKAMRSVDLTLGQLRLALYHMTEYIPQEAQKAATSGPEDFVVPNNKMVYSSNGWDSMPNDPNKPMPLIPSIRKNKFGEIMYDHDQINLGRHHLTKNGKDIEVFLSKWGDRCSKWMQILSDPTEKAIAPLYQQRSQNSHVPIDVWSNIIGNANRFGNRTNAETLAEIIAKYPDWQSFHANVLSTTIASQFTKSTPVKNTDMQTMISPAGFELLKRYGYAASKIMDFTNGIMIRSCEEGITSRTGDNDQQTEWFFGRTYSTSQGKAEFGQVVIGVRYAFSARALGSHDAGLKKIVDRHRSHYQIKKPTAENPEIMRETRHFQQGTQAPGELQPSPVPVLRVMENMSFWVGNSASEARFLKSDDIVQDLVSWQDVISIMQERFPAVENDLGVVFEPLHANLNSLSIATKKALSKIVDEVRSQQAEVEVVFIDKDNKTQVLESTEVDIESDVNEENIRIDQEQNGITESEQFSSEPTDQYLQGQPQGQNSVGPATATPATAPATGSPNQTSIPQPNQTVDIQAPEIGQKPNQPKSMPSPDFISRKIPQTLIRHGPDPYSHKIRKSSLIENLIKVSDKLDKYGSVDLANKIDKFIKKISKE